jgi:hypothetical protein
MIQGRDQDHDHPQVDLAPEEAHRSRCVASPATVSSTAEAQTTLIGVIQGRAQTAGLTWIAGTVQHTATVATPRCQDRSRLPLGGFV